ncbi:MAG: thymidine phosphorylase [Methylobacterium sp.]|nr:MAG: thymidine phosphorylase [Methylobacterium sp.]
MFLPQEIIRKKRDGQTLGEAEIGFLITGLVDGRVTGMQAAAFAMAVFLNGMNRDEAVALTRAMTRSGTVMNWDSLALPGPVLDKHSTGGVGDLVSLILAPAVAACGGFVPMISGRGLGHTGGTLDKLESIPGYSTRPDPAQLGRTVREIGTAIIGQTEDLAPADKRLYAIRDVTATVESIPLITASILSKKLAAGLAGLVMDVKTGSGAFMASLEKSRALAESIVAVANGAGLKTTALITDMNQPLAPAAGNAVEVMNAIQNLTGVREDRRLLDVTIALGGEMLATGGLAASPEEGRGRIATAIESGKAAEIFGQMVAALGGPSDLMAKPEAHLAAAPLVRPVLAGEAGHVTRIDTRAIGLAVVAMGGGRTRAEDAIDHAVGLTDLAELGTTVERNTPLALVHARSDAQFEAAARTIRAAYAIGDGPAPEDPLIAERITVSA